MAGAILSLLLNSIWQSALLAAAGFLATRLLARESATTRYRIWLVVLVAAGLVPVAGRFDASRVVRAGAVENPPYVSNQKTETAPRMTGAVGTPAEAAGPTVSGPPVVTTINTPAQLGRNLLLAYLAIAALLGLRVVVDIGRMIRLKRRAAPLPVRLEIVLARCRRVFGVRRRLRYASSTEIGTPVFVGLLRPMLLLPQSSLATVQEDELVQVGAHELAHAQRRDDWLALIERITRALLFFNPALRWICAQLSLEREMACDEWVVARAGTAPHEYATTLLRVAERAVWNRRGLPYAAALDGSSLRRRIDWLLSAPERARIQRTPLRSTAAVALLVAAPIGALVTPGVVLEVAHAAVPSAASWLSPVVGAATVRGKDAAPRLESAIDALEAAGYSGAALVAIENEIVLRRGFGVANRQSREKIEAGTHFHSGAIAKMLTAAAILRLEAMGKLSVNDPLSRWIGPLPAPKRDVTIHHLLVHAGGLTPEAQPVFADHREDFIRGLRETPADFAPGTRQRHTDIGYSTLALVVELASGRSYEEFVRTELLKRAGMHNTWFQNEPPLGDVAIEYTETGDPASAVGIRPYLWGRRGAMGVYSNVEDLYKWQLALERGLFMHRDIRRMYTAELQNPWGSITGYGWETRTSVLGNELYHVLSGWPGNSVELMHDPAARMTIALIVDNRVDWLRPRSIALQHIALGRDQGGLALRRVLQRIPN